VCKRGLLCMKMKWQIYCCHQPPSLLHTSSMQYPFHTSTGSSPQRLCCPLCAGPPRYAEEEEKGHKTHLLSDSRSPHVKQKYLLQNNAHCLHSLTHVPLHSMLRLRSLVLVMASRSTLLPWTCGALGSSCSSCCLATPLLVSAEHKLMGRWDAVNF